MRPSQSLSRLSQVSGDGAPGTALQDSVEPVQLQVPVAMQAPMPELQAMPMRGSEPHGAEKRSAPSQFSSTALSGTSAEGRTSPEHALQVIVVASYVCVP